MTGQPPGSLVAAAPAIAHTLRRFAPLIRRRWPLVASGGAGMLLEVLLRLAEPWPLKLIFDRVLAQDPDAASGVGWADRLDPVVLLVGSALAFVAIAALRAAAAYVSTVSFALVGNKVLSDVRAELYRHLQRLSLRFHHGARTGDLITRMTSDIGRLQDVTVTAALPLVGNAVTLVGMVAVMAWVDWRLALASMAAFPLFAVTLRGSSRKIHRVARQQRKGEGALASTAGETFGAIRVIQAYTLESMMGADFDGHNARSLSEGVKGTKLSAGLERKTDLLVGLGTGIVLLAGASLVREGELTPGDLLVFLTYMKNAYKPLRDVAKYAGRISKAAASGERIIELLDERPDVLDRPGALVPSDVAGALRLEGVSLHYGRGDPALRQVDLAVAAGSTVAIVGPSGSGKSSLLSLILRLYDPTEGRVLLDGRDLREYQVDGLRRQMAVVLQDSILFAVSVRDNVGYGRPGATDAEIEAAVRLAGAHDFVTALPDGYDTVLAERGATLSGGQRQRLAIARAALRDAPVVLLDEPTSGLDAASAEVVDEALRRLTRDRTCIVVAHELRTVVHADQILFMQEGCVTESGTHEELLAADGTYAALFRLQERTGIRAHAVA